MQPTLAVISLKTIVRNALLVQGRADAPLIAVVKDDAYGHGAERVASALEPYVIAFAVATVLEGAALRIAGISKEIFVLTPCLCEEEAAACAAYGLIPTVSCLAALRFFKEYTSVQLAVNTGMNRYGVRPAHVKRVCREIKARGLDVVGIFSHFYAPEDKEAREEQYRLFRGASATAKEYFPHARCHLSATGGILAGEKYNFDAVRSGIALYGYLPAGFAGRLEVQPAMKLYATVAGSGKFAGGGVGYAKAERKYGMLHTLRLGYGDGFFRAGGLGATKLCMDACIAEGYAPFGRKKLVMRSVTDYAHANGTTEYEALVKLLGKAVKVYV